MDTVYVKIRHMLFWYGHYGFCSESCNDEIAIYADAKGESRLGSFEIATESGLRHWFENSSDDEALKELIAEVKMFIESSEITYFSYTYPFPCEMNEEEDYLRQVSHFAPVDENGFKPVYIKMWSKLHEYWTCDTVKQCVKLLSKEFFHMDITNVEIIDMPTYEEARLSYEEDIELGAKYD